MIGILTERDMLKAMAGRVHTSEARVREWMTADQITAAPETSTDEAAQTMIANGFRRPPVAPPAKTIGSTGSTQGEMAVMNPAARPMPISTSMRFSA